MEKRKALKKPDRGAHMRSSRGEGKQGLHAEPDVTFMRAAQQRETRDSSGFQLYRKYKNT